MTHVVLVTSNSILHPFPPPIFLLSAPIPIPSLDSFPTRRSSDLRGGQQLRARHRRRHRHLRRNQWAGAGRGGRPVDRGACPRRSRLRLPVGCTPLVPHRPLPERNEPPMTTDTTPTDRKSVV